MNTIDHSASTGTLEPEKIEQVARAPRPDSFAMEVFYDGECPMCAWEINWLKRKDRSHRVNFIDIAADTFNPAEYGRTQHQFMAEMHGRLADGTWTVGVETFRHLYGLLGLGWLLSWTRWPGLRTVADIGYRIFAANRIRVGGSAIAKRLFRSGHAGRSCRLDSCGTDNSDSNADAGGKSATSERS